MHALQLCCHNCRSIRYTYRESTVLISTLDFLYLFHHRPYMLPDDWLEEAADTVSKASKVNATVVVSDISTRSLTEMNIKAQGHPDEHEIVRPQESMDENRDQKSCSRDDAKEFLKWRSQHDSPLWRWWQKSQFIRKAGSYQPIL